MLRKRGIACFLVLLLLAVCAGGCIPGDSHVDEEKDPHFQRGRNLASSQDFPGAVNEFEKALETNPRSAAAHFELGWLYDTKINDYAAAIYHYERYLQLQPNSQRAQSINVKERIRGCKRELADAEFPIPNDQNLQRVVDRLTAENMALTQQLDSLRAQWAQAANVVVAQAPISTGYYSPRTAARPTNPMRSRVHIVRERETISSIAAQYGVRISAVLGANPRVDPRRLRVGQALNMP